MTTTPFAETTTLLEQRDVLREGYQPNEIIERDEEIQQYAHALKPVIDGFTPNNVFIYGKTGVGKTAVTKYMIDMLYEEVDDESRITVVTVNCKKTPTSYQTAIDFANELAGEEVVRNGHSTAVVMDTLHDRIEATGGTVLFVLDEIDQLGDDDDLLYDLPRAKSNGYIEDAKVGLIGISNDYTYRQNLSPKVKDTLMEKEIKFTTYDATELQTILQKRAEMALTSTEYLAEGVIRLCSALAVKDKGSARQAIDLFREACDAAESKGQETVTEANVREAESRVKRGRIEEAIPDLTSHGRLALLAVANAEVQKDTPLRTKELFEYYCGVAQTNGIDPLSQRSLHDHADDLTMLGFVNRREHNQGRKGGKYFEYELDIPTDSVFTALDELDA
jgi:cell division control protein 6